MRFGNIYIGRGRRYPFSSSRVIHVKKDLINILSDKVRGQSIEIMRLRDEVKSIRLQIKQLRSMINGLEIELYNLRRLCKKVDGDE